MLQGRSISENDSQPTKNSEIPERMIPHSSYDDYCIECGKDMSDTDSNFGTESVLVCAHCYFDVNPSLSYKLAESIDLSDTPLHEN